MTNTNLEGMNENMNKMSQSVYNAGKAFYAMNINTCEQLFDQQIAMATLGVNSITSQMELMSTAKDYKAVIAGQTDIGNDISSTSQGIVRNTMDIMTESRENVSAWAEDVAKKATANIEMVKAA